MGGMQVTSSNQLGKVSGAGLTKPPVGKVGKSEASVQKQADLPMTQEQITRRLSELNNQMKYFTFYEGRWIENWNNKAELEKECGAAKAVIELKIEALKKEQSILDRNNHKLGR